MSSFVLCDDSDWKEMYEDESHKWFRLQEASDLLGHPNIIVFVHDDWIGSVGDDRREYLEQQIETLAIFGYVKLVYKWADGKEEKFKMDTVQVIENPQVDMFEKTKTESNATIVYETEDDGCEGGACKI
jgi:hypothetical protein